MTRLIEADELVVTTRDVEFAIECQRAMKPQRPVWFNGLSFAVTRIAQDELANRWVLTLARCHQMTGGPYPDVDSPELTDDQLSRLRPARGPGEEREGTVETFIDVTNENGSGIRVDFAPSAIVGVMNARVQIKFVEIKGDSHHGLTDEQWALFQTLQEAFTAGQTLTFDFGGKTYTGVRIKSLTKEA